MTAPKGYSNQKMRGPARHQTVQTLGSDRTGIPTAQMYLYEKTVVAIGIISVTKTAVVKQTRKEDLTELLIEFDNPHNGKKFDIMRMMDGVLEGWEFEILKVVDATKVIVYNIGDLEGVEQLPQVGDTTKTLRWTTALSDQSGALQVSQGPVQFVRDALVIEVNEDTAVPANNRPIPAGLYIVKDGVAYPVTKDTGTPANTVAIPVELSGVAGPVNITAGDLNVQLSDLGANFDATRVGDGSGFYLEINADGSINVVDAAVATKLDTLLATDFATSAKQDAALTALGLLSTAAKQDVAKAVLDNILTALGPLSTAAKQDAEAVLLGGVTEAAPATDTASSGLNGRLQRIAQRLTSLIALLPASLGQKLMASSLAVTLASDQSALSTTPTAMVGSYQQDLTVSDAAVETFAAPAGSKWVLLQADELNTGNIRVKIGAAATTTSGMVLQPGRDMKLDCGGDVSYTSEVGGSGKLYAQFGV